MKTVHASSSKGVQCLVKCPTFHSLAVFPIEASSSLPASLIHCLFANHIWKHISSSVIIGSNSFFFLCHYFNFMLCNSVNHVGNISLWITPCGIKVCWTEQNLGTESVKEVRYWARATVLSRSSVEHRLEPSHCLAVPKVWCVILAVMWMPVKIFAFRMQTRVCCSQVFELGLIALNDGRRWEQLLGSI